MKTPINLTSNVQAIQSDNFSYVSIATLRNTFPRVQGQAPAKPEKPQEVTKSQKAKSSE